MNETGKLSGGNSADLVVYGKIFTSENQTVEAFAVKDGRYVYNIPTEVYFAGKKMN